MIALKPVGPAKHAFSMKAAIFVLAALSLSVGLLRIQLEWTDDRFLILRRKSGELNHID
jgi:hypothetical protein